MTQGEQFVLVEVDAEGLLLNLQSGLLVHLNRSASFIWGRHLAGIARQEIVVQFSRQFAISLDQAERDIDSALKTPAAKMPSEAPGEFNYERSASGFVYSMGGRPLLTIDDRGQSVCRSDRTDLSIEDVWRCLHGVAPKLLSLRGEIVLHASGVDLGDGIVLFLGLSGAGKTTTARVLVDQGASAVCEDKLVVRLVADRVEALLETERIVTAWADGAATDLVERGFASCERLADIERSPTAPIKQIGFLSASRRQFGPLDARPLTSAESAGGVFSNSFHGSDNPEDWRRHVVMSAQIASRVEAYILSMPDGADRLVAAAKELLARRSLRS